MPRAIDALSRMRRGRAGSLLVTIVLPVLLAAFGAFAGLVVFGRSHESIGPFDATLAVRLDLHGDTVVHLAPLGTLRLDTHDGPIGLDVVADELRPDAARAVVSDPASLDVLENNVADDLRRAARTVILRAVLGALLGAITLSLLREWSRRGFAMSLATALVVVAIAGISARVTWDADAIAEPKYTGLLSAAPQAVGSVRDIRARFDAYRDQLTRLVGNVSGLYRAFSQLDALETDSSTIRLLHVSDLHLNPQGFDLAGQLAKQFRVDAVVDTGDIVDWGTDLESRYTNAIADLKVPYVYVRGNHDSAATAAAVAAQPNAAVLDDGVTEVRGLRIWGIGDPRFTPDKSISGDKAQERREAEAFADEVARLIPSGIDIAMVHDPAIATKLGGQASLVLAGHSHRTQFKRLSEPGTTTTSGAPADPTFLIVEGSTGGAGLRALEGKAPEPLTATVLHIDAATRRLVAYDRITVAGLGATDVRIERHLVP